jgi:nitroreductase
MGVNALALIKERRSIRAFLNRPVSLDLLKKILENASFAPSGANTQPWKVSILRGSILKKIGDVIVSARDSGQKPEPDYIYYPTTWVSPYPERRNRCGQQLYQALNIQREDKEARTEAWYRNYYFFDAPVGLLFWIEPFLEKGSWLDTGMFIQNLMLSARAVGLESCAQASLAEYPGPIRSLLNMEQGEGALHLICGMALGYADWDNPVNQYRTERAPIETFSYWIDD